MDPMTTQGVSYESLKPGFAFAGRYELLRLLGQGGFGKVFAARDLLLEVPVALKVLDPALAHDRQHLKRFRREVVLARQIAHRNVCSLYDIGQAGPMAYITMEHIDGQDLHTLLAQRRTLFVREGLEIGMQVAAGLAEAHWLGIVHRDIKPRNVMLECDGTAKILDFGIARAGRRPCQQAVKHGETSKKSSHVSLEIHDLR